MKKSRGFRGQLKLDITKLQREKDKIERRVQKMVQELVLIDNLIKAMEVARNPEAALSAAAEAIQTAQGTQEANASLDKALQETQIKEAITNANPLEGLKVELTKEDSNVQAQG